MRRTALVFAASLLLAAPMARAAPTCQIPDGGPIRCGVAGAMPVGWTLPADQRAPMPADDPAPPLPDTTWSLICVLVGFFALIALMPRFDGRWDAQEGDEDEG